MAITQDHTEYRRRKTAEVVEQWRLVDGCAKRIEDDDCGPDFVSKDVYLSREWFEREKEYFWPHVWQMACREHDLSRVGDYFEYEICDETILIVRSPGGALKAFHNVCRHRGRKIKEGCGHASRLRCGYHGWAWDLDGNIAAVLDAPDFRPDLICPEELALRPVRVETWGGFVFVNLDLAAPPLEAAIAPIPARIGRFVPERLRIAKWRRAVVPINWKAGVDAFHEAYHAFATHPQLAAYMDDTRTGLYERWENGTTLLGASNWLETMAAPSGRLRGDVDPKKLLLTMIEDLAATGVLSEEDLALAETMRDLELPPGEEGQQTIRALFATHRRMQMTALGLDLTGWADHDVIAPEQFLFFPNVIGPLQLGTGMFFRFRPNGDDHLTSLFDYWELQFFPEGEEPAYEIEEPPDFTADSWGLLVAQDLANLAAVGKGMRSRSFDGVRLGYQENNLKFFYRKLAGILGWDGQPPQLVY